MLQHVEATNVKIVKWRHHLKAAISYRQALHRRFLAAKQNVDEAISYLNGLRHTDRLHWSFSCIADRIPGHLHVGQPSHTRHRVVLRSGRAALRLYQPGKTVAVDSIGILEIYLGGFAIDKRRTI